MRVFGLIGYPLSHSFSRKYFTDRFEEEGLDCTYRNFELPHIQELPDLIRHTAGLCGLNVTIPYKEQVIPYLHQVDEVVGATGACNCIRISNGLLHGFNTDVTGFERSLKKKLLPHQHRKALVLGTGGASKAIAYVLESLGIAYAYVSRTPGNTTGTSMHYDEVTEAILQEYMLVINTTPVGMFPNAGIAPPLPYEYLSSGHFLFDLIYNPEKTEFLKRGEERGAAIENGYEMLIIQAEESWKIWNADNRLFRR